MKKIVEKLSWKAGETKWSGYRHDNTYSNDDDKAKQGYDPEVVAAAASRFPSGHGLQRRCLLAHRRRKRRRTRRSPSTMTTPPWKRSTAR